MQPAAPGTVGAVNEPWAGSVTPVAPPVTAVPRLPTLLYAAAVTGIWSGLLSLAVYGIGRLIGVPFAVVLPGATEAAPIPWFAPLLVPIAAAFAAALLAGLVLGWRHARRIVFWGGTGIALISCLGPLLQPAEVGWATRVWLLVPHAITWFLVVPQIARIVGDSEPGMFEPFDARQ